ncbi:hypothetical protein G7046_g1064 [Stylonectria norvegica]|nr:hypothetical protein G7046_g1064 [Stylonectria norvegica]
MPVEIISLIAKLLPVEALFNLSSTCRHLLYIIYDENMCRVALQNFRFSPEAIEAQASLAYAKGLRRLVKRRTAIRSADPYLVCVVALVESFVYSKGVLCYMLNPAHLRVLDIHGSATTETVVGIPWLLDTRIPGFTTTKTYHFKPLYHSDGILTSLYRHVVDGQALSWLVILDLTTLELLDCHRLLSTLKLFDIQRREWIPLDIIFWSSIGAEIGVNICFEIIDDYLYCLSNQTILRPEEGKWNSYYKTFRFPVDQPTRERTDVPPRRSLWRRHASEGPVDWRWTSLQIAKDEGSGEIFAYESRREWLETNSSSQRTCYKKELKFPKSSSVTAFHVPGFATDDEVPDVAVVFRDLSHQLQEEHHQQSEPDWDKNTHTEKRLPEDVHVGDSGASDTVFTINECFVRTYVPSCETFLDLVNIPLPSQLTTQRLRLRVRPKPDAYETATALTNAVNTQPPMKETASPSGVANPSMHNTACFWPPEKDTTISDAVMADLNDIMNPTKELTGVDWAMDDRTLVYTPGCDVQGRFKPLVLVSFDSGIKLPGFKKLRAGPEDTTGPDSFDAFQSEDLPPYEPRCAGDTNTAGWPSEDLPPYELSSAVDANTTGPHTLTSENLPLHELPPAGACKEVTPESSRSCQAPQSGSSAPHGKEPAEEDNFTRPTRAAWAKITRALYLGIPKVSGSSSCGYEMFSDEP